MIKDNYFLMNKTYYNSYGRKMKIKEYINYSNIIVEFDNGYKKKTSYLALQKGNVKNPYDVSVCNTGYLGDGIYTRKNNIEVYICWKHMIERCLYNEKYYKDCIINEEWYNFQNFCKWYYDNIYYIKDEKLEIDKDILIKGNKIYSKDTCLFVPQHINLLIHNNKKIRGDCCIGVSKKKNKFISQCWIKYYQKFLGYYDTEKEAFQVYKKYKEDYIKK